MHKLLYIIYGTYLILEKKPLFNDDRGNCPSCFEHGPLFKSVQREYKKENINFEDSSIDENILNIIDVVIREFGAYSATALSNWSHREGSAWDRAEKEDENRWGNIIKDEFIRAEFKNIAKLDKNG